MAFWGSISEDDLYGDKSFQSVDAKRKQDAAGQKRSSLRGNSRLLTATIDYQVQLLDTGAT